MSHAILLAMLLGVGPHLKVRVGKTVVEMPLERYVAAVLAGESSVFRSPEALKAMAVAARTYGVRMRGRHASEGFDVCDTAHCQRVDQEQVDARLTRAASDTAGEFLWYQGWLAFTPYTRDCGGVTEDAAAVWPDLAAPYLRSQVDPYCKRETWEWRADPRDVDRALRAAQLRGNAQRIAISARTASGRAKTLLLGDTPISASTFRFAIGRTLGWLHLPSDRYEIGANLAFSGTGAGHGVGMCQFGAEASGRSYQEILAFYYPGTLLGLTARGLVWHKYDGSAISVFATQPLRGELDAAQDVAEKLRARLHWPLPANVELRFYPDIDTFRNATGEPGWVAAHTEGMRIDLQPAAVLRARNALESTITHELLHVMIESRAAPALPLWYREGLVEYLTSGRGNGVARIPSDAELRNTRDQAVARRAYADATAMVAKLARTYDDAALLAFVSRGLPPDVFKASAIQAAPKNK